MEVRWTENHGRGVFATRAYKKGTLIEKAHCIFLPIDQVPDDSIIAYYVFNWDNKRYALLVSIMSLLNHSDHPNVVPHCDYANSQISFKAIHAIENGEELKICYGYETMLEEKLAKFARGESK